MKITILGEPKGKGRARARVMGGRFAQMYTPKDTVEYENYIKLLFVQSNATIIVNKPVIATLKAFYSIPKAFSKVNTQKALQGELRPLKKPDIDNIQKIVFDALNGLAYKDDTQIVRVVCEKWYDNQPRIELELSEYGYED